ncbi:MAG: aldehyde dehydrogenase family protein, partial [Ancalomicrobiaceae bacterium]|nr:aldehyde dehydrogenase family protein [Ancalomicrobiaceae bacterium]
RRLSHLAPPTTQAIIGSGLSSAQSGATRAVTSPIDGRTIAEIPDCDAADVDRAVAAARRVFEARHWQGMAPKQRKRILVKWAELVAAEHLPLAVLQSRDMGMPVGMAEGFEVAFAIDALSWYAETADKLYDEMVQLEDNVTSLVFRAPLGIVGAILPWNAPAMIGAWKLGPALATGNSVIVKPAEDASLVIMRIAELGLEAGLPEGVLQVVTGDGKAGAALAAHMDVDAITFTGSGEVGRHIMSAAAASNLKRVSLELGGKSANIVMADAPDLEAAAEVSVRFMFGNQGQVCEAPTRLLVQKPIREAFVEAVVTKARSLKVGDPLDLTSDLGPIINESQRSMILGRIERATREGARLALDGRKAEVPQAGTYLAPSVATDVDPKGSLAQEEVFGPVLAVMEFDTVDEAIALANSTRYGLGASIWSSHLDTVLYASKRLVAGNIAVNGGTGPVVELPFGGFKQSGFGRDRSLHALEKYTDLKTVTLRTAR